MIEVINLFKTYGEKKALDGISFKVEKGEIVALIGPNGSGKSTTMKCIASLVYPSAGKIMIDNFEVNPKNHRILNKVGFMIESPGLYQFLSGIDNLKLAASLAGASKGKLIEIIELIGIGEGIKRNVNTYSMGMKQRLAFGIALIKDPDYLILDEPFNGLDPSGVFEFRSFITKLSNNGCGILISSHQLLELEKISTRKLFLNEGKFIDKDELMALYQSEYKISINHNYDITNQVLIKYLDELKNLDIITNYRFDRTDLLVNFKKDYINQFIKELVNLDVLINSFTPVSEDIEETYRVLYGETNG